MKSWTALLLLCLAACGDSTGINDGFAREFTFDDPVGDTALFAESVDSFPAIDVRRVSGTVTSDSLILTLEFVDPITRASDAAPNSLWATFGVDADDDGTTGIPVDSTGDESSDTPPFTGPFPATTGVGAEYWIFVDPASDGDAEVYRTLTLETVGTFPASYSGSSMTMRIPLSVFGIPAAHPFRIVGNVGTSQRLTDLIPNSSSYLVGGSS